MIADCLTRLSTLGRSCQGVWDDAVDESLGAIGPQLDQLFREIRFSLAKGGRILVLGYPRFFPDPAEGDCDFAQGLPTGVFSQGEQDWLNSKLKLANRGVNYEVLAAVNRARRDTSRVFDRVQFEYVDVEELFDGNELCVAKFGGDPVPTSPVMNGLICAFCAENVWSFHPNLLGQQLLARAVLTEYQDGGPGRTERVLPGSSLAFNESVSAGLAEVTFATTWSGSDVVMSLRSPSGRLIARDSTAEDVVHELGSFYERYTVLDPEPGIWSIGLFGADVPDEGEDVLLEVIEFPRVNQPPIAQLTAAPLVGEAPLTVSFNGAGSNDPDGVIDAYTWYFGDGSTGSGESDTHTYDRPGRYRVMLAVTDIDGAIDFTETYITAELSIDVKPDSTKNPIRLRSQGVVPLAIFGLVAFDVTDLDPATLRAGPALTPSQHDLSDPATYGSHLDDVNGDGLLDLVLHFRTSQLGLLESSTELCVQASTLAGDLVEGCDEIRTNPTGHSVRAV